MNLMEWFLGSSRMVIWVLTLFSTGACAQRPSIVEGADGCDAVPMLTSASGHTFVGVRREKVYDLRALRSLTPVIHISVLADNTDPIVLSVWLWGEGFVRNSAANCEANSDPVHGETVSCAMSIHGTELGMTVLYPPGFHDGSHRTELLMERVVQEVLCDPMRATPRTTR